MDGDTINDLYGVWGSSATNVFAVGENGKILHYKLDLAVTSFLINNGATSTTQPNVRLNNTCIGNPTHYMASESPSFTGASWNVYPTSPRFALSSGYGWKTIYFKVKNEVEESEVVSDKIRRRVRKPAVTTFNLNDLTLEKINYYLYLF